MLVRGVLLWDLILMMIDAIQNLVVCMRREGTLGSSESIVIEVPDLLKVSIKLIKELPSYLYVVDENGRMDHIALFIGGNRVILRNKKDD